jgi:molybdopterin molybdotransferase
MANELIEVDRARDMVLARCSPLGAETIALADVLGRVLAEDVTSPEDVPSFDNSAMDGFAVRAADTQGASADSPVSLALVGESRAGTPAQASLSAGQAISISTGAMVPSGADAVVRREDATRADQTVEIHVDVRPGLDIRRAGEDAAAGDRVMDAGTTIGPGEAGVLASVARSEALCARRPAVAVLTTGDELLEPSDPMRPGGIRNSNAHTVPALVRRAGGEPAQVSTVPDDAAATRERIEGALDAEVVVISGGVSVGDHDHVRPALAELGVEEVFWGLALRPGKPTWFGVHGGGPGEGGALVFGLPGNPVSVMVTFTLICRPAIRALMGAPADDALRATAIFGERYAKRPGRAHAVRCRLDTRDGRLHASPTKAQGSHVLTSMLGADALAMLPTDGGDVEAGDEVQVQLLGERRA